MRLSIRKGRNSKHHSTTRLLFTITKRDHYNNSYILIIIIIIIANLYTRFSHEAQSAYSVLLPRSLATFQCRTYSAQFPLPREHSLPGIAAYNDAGKFKHSNLSPPTGSPIYTPGSRAAMWINCLAKGQKWRGDGEIRTRALSVRVEWILQYTTTPPQPLKP